MSLQSWKDEFYPVPACAVEKEDALAHSLNKWEGLTKANLKKHGIKKEGDYIYDEVVEMCIDADSCALCVWFLGSVFQDNEKPCVKCPLYKARNQTPCDVNLIGMTAPYIQFTDNNNPQPMIRLIKKAINQTNV